MGTYLTPEEKKVIMEVPGVEGIPAAEFDIPTKRLFSLYAAILRGEPKPGDLTQAEELNWDLIAEEIAAAPPDTPWRIPG